ncbi:MAG: hypothetical protein HY084_14090 [Gemmatimonadetes bacterium]|nr:hypothetical protein [Gemmatimonadota bacterium]
MIVFALASAAWLGVADTVARPPVGPRDAPVGIMAAPEDTTRRKRAKAVEISDQYATRLKIHKIASYATLPLFAVQYIAGQAMYDADSKGNPRPQWAYAVHTPAAIALGGLFAVNTVTGAMNWWETRGEEKGRTWRTIHAALMLASDAGFAYTGSLGNGQARYSYEGRDHHRQWAINSSLVALAAYAMMLDPIRRDK